MAKSNRSGPARERKRLGISGYSRAMRAYYFSGGRRGGVDGGPGDGMGIAAPTLAEWGADSDFITADSIFATADGAVLT